MQKCDGDSHTLPHPAGKLVWVGTQTRFRRWDSNLRQQFGSPCFCRSFTQRFMRVDGELHLLSDGQHRIERRNRVLKDHRDISAPARSQIGVRQLGQFHAIQLDRPFDNPSRRIDQTEKRKPGHCLARPAFPDKPQNLTRSQIKRDPINRFHNACAGEEMGAQVADAEDRIAHRRSLGLNWSRT